MEWTEKLTLAKDIKWRGVRRIGIILIHDDGYCKWIGLGVTREKNNITSIGGEFEPTKDNNIFETAIREYKEELGNNYPPLDKVTICNSWAIQDHLIVNIFHPVSYMLLNIDNTDEIQSLVWLTPRQLYDIKKKKQFRMSYWIDRVVNDICYSVDSGQPFIICKNITHINYIEKQEEKKIVSTSYDNFKKDIVAYTGVAPLCSVCTDKNSFAVRTKQKTYILEKKYFADAMNQINDIKIGIMVPGSKVHFKSFCSSLCVLTLHDVAFRRYDESTRSKTIALYQEYVSFLREIKPKPKGTHLIDQLDLLEHYELKIYLVTKEHKKNEEQFIVYKMINCVNYELSIKPLPLENLESILYKRYLIEVDDIKQNVKKLLNCLIIQDENTGLCHIK